MLQRHLENRPKHRIVYHDRRTKPLPLFQFVGNSGAGLQVDQAVGRIGRGLDQDQPYPTLCARSFGDQAHPSHVGAIGEAEGGDVEGAHLFRQQRLRAAVERAAMQDRVARAQERKQRGGNRRHAAGENSGLFRLIPDRQTVLQDFKIRVVETRIDEASLLARTQLATARSQIEEILALLCILEDEGRREKNRWLERTFGEAWCVAIAHHQRFRVQPAIGDSILVIVIVCHGALFHKGVVVWSNFGRVPLPGDNLPALAQSTHLQSLRAEAGEKHDLGSEGADQPIAQH